MILHKILLHDDGEIIIRDHNLCWLCEKNDSSMTMQFHYTTQKAFIKKKAQFSFLFLNKQQIHLLSLPMFDIA